MSMQDPFFGVYFAQFDERQSKFFYGFKVSYPEQVFFRVRINHSAHPLHSGMRTKAGEDAIQGHLLSF